MIRLALVAILLHASPLFAKDAPLDYVMQGLSTQENLRAHALHIQSIAPELTDMERSAVLGQLRRLGIFNFSVLGLMIDAGLATPAEETRFLSMASLHFARFIERAENPSPAHRNPLAIPVQDADRAISNTLASLSREMRAGSRNVRANFEKALEHAVADRAFAYKKNNRLLFFEMFEDGSLDWTSYTMWMIRAGHGGASRAFQLRSQYRTDGNVIRPFAFKGRCEDSLS